MKKKGETTKFTEVTTYLKPEDLMDLLEIPEGYSLEAIERSPKMRIVTFTALRSFYKEKSVVREYLIRKLSSMETLELLGWPTSAQLYSINTYGGSHVEAVVRYDG